MALSRGYKEAFARFFEEPTREAFRELLKQETGEFGFLDFKEKWISDTKLARHVLGCANSGNACLVIGVKEEDDKSLSPVGIENFADKTDVLKGIAKFLPQGLLASLDILDFNFTAAEYPKIVGRRFQVVFIPYDPIHVPLLALRDGENIKSTVIYVRRQNETIEANHHEVQDVINRRLETKHSSAPELGLKHHLEQLRILEAETPTFDARAFFRILGGMSSQGEPYTRFIRRMIRAKKLIIQNELGITPGVLRIIDATEPPGPVRGVTTSEPNSGK